MKLALTCHPHSPISVLLCIFAACTLHAQAISEWAFPGPDHRLHYRLDEHGNSIMDFSFAGYRAGGVALPSVAVYQRLTPSAGDSTARIQAALDKATGAVVLTAGDYELAGTLSITHGGVVLRGEKGATIRLIGSPHRFLEVHGGATWHEESARAPILDPYVPSGSRTFRVREPAAFHPGDQVLVLHPLIDAPVGSDTVIRTDRVIESIEGDRITLDVPLSDALDSRVISASLVRYSFPGRITEVGVEGLRIVTPFEDSPAALHIDAIEDGWIRDLEIQDTHNAIAIGPAAKRLTVTNIRTTHSTLHSGSAASADFMLHGTQILLDRCGVKGEGTSPVATQPAATGPLVVLNLSADRGGVAAYPYWATGVLVDGGKFPGVTQDKPGIAFSSRNVGWAVAWNVNSPFLLVQQPPGAMNWCIGCVGSPVTIADTPNGIFDSLGIPVHPFSLYLQQLRDRLGPDAVRNIGYADSLRKLL
jgi:hypothetical protein